MSRIPEIIARAKKSADPSLLTAAIPYAGFMGITMEAMDAADMQCSELRGVMRFTDMLVGNPVGPNLHGGTLGALLESTAIFQLLWSLEIAHIPKIINITIHYLRAGRPMDTYARGIITKHGRTVATVRVEAWQDALDRPIAVGYTHFLIRHKTT